MQPSRFFRKDGRLTVYAFICGYREVKEFDSRNRAVLELDSIWHVKGFKEGKHFWETFPRNELAKARKFYNNCLK